MASATEEGKDEDCFGRQRRAGDAAGRIVGVASVSGTATGGTASGTTVVSAMLARVAFDDAPLRRRVITGCASRVPQRPAFRHAEILVPVRFTASEKFFYIFFPWELRARNSIVHHSSRRTAR